MAKFNPTARVLYVEGTDLIRTFFYTAVIIPLDNVWDIKFLVSHEKDGIQYYEMYVYYNKNEVERRLQITEREYDSIQSELERRR